MVQKQMKYLLYKLHINFYGKINYVHKNEVTTNIACNKRYASLLVTICFSSPRIVFCVFNIYTHIQLWEIHILLRMNEEKLYKYILFFHLALP